MAHATPVLKSVRAIEKRADDSFTLLYDDKTQDQVPASSIIAAVPNKLSSNAETDDLTLLYVENPPAATTADANEEDAAPHPFNGHLAARTVPKACAEQLHSYTIQKLPGHLEASQQRQMHVVVSTKSGLCDAEIYYERVVQPVLSYLGLSKGSVGAQKFELHLTRTHHYVSDLAEKVIGPQANRGIAQTLLILSGDGAIVDLVNGICNAERSANYVKPIVGLLALGTGNALANSSGLNSNSTYGLSSFILGIPKSIPVFKARFSPGSEVLYDEGQAAAPLAVKDPDGSGVMYGVVVASWALHASLVGNSDTTEYRRHGTARFAMAAQELLSPADGSESHVYKGKVLAYQRTGAGAEFPTHWMRREHMYILATFVSHLEKTLTISPRSKPLDKTLRLLHWGKLDSQDVKDIFGMAYAGGQHTELDVVGYEAIEGMRIDFEEEEGRWRRVCIDGKIVRVDKGGWVEIRRHDEEIADLVTDAS